MKLKEGQSALYDVFYCSKEMSKSYNPIFPTMNFVKRLIIHKLNPKACNFIILCCLFFAIQGHAQSFELGIGPAISNYSGDLTDNTQSIIKQSCLALSSHLRYEFSNSLSVQAQYNLLKIKADDALSGQLWQQQRNLNFQSLIHDFNISAQLNIISFFKPDPVAVNPFLCLGFSYFTYDPTTKYEDKTIHLQSLGTEGQGLPAYPSYYALKNYAFNFGIGLRYFLANNFSITAELVSHQSQTDYLDDASGDYVDYDILLKQKGKLAADLGNKIRAAGGSQRASAVDKDWYNHFSLTANYHFGHDFGLKKIKFKRNRVSCPKI